MTLRAEQERAVSPSRRSVSSPASNAKPPARRNWRKQLSRRMWLTDLAVLICVVYGAQTIRFRSPTAPVIVRSDSYIPAFSYWIFSAFLIIAWMTALGLTESRSDRVMGAGNLEYRKVVDSSLRVFGLVAIVSFLLRAEITRGYLLLALPAGVILLLFCRWLWRQWLVRQRAHGRFSARALLVGSETSIAQISRELQRSSQAGYLVVGACLPVARDGCVAGTDIPVLGSVNDVDAAMARVNADTVAITSTDELPPTKVKEISWGLEAGRQHLVLAPSIIDIAGPRIHTRPVAGLPLIHVETPRLSLGQRFTKRTVDLVLSLTVLVLMSPLLLVLALLVKFSGPGPVLFKQRRVGRHGREFRMFKFRSMVQGAEDLLPSLLDETRDSGNEILFKMRNDPRVTKVGRWMRRFSLDELPQLFNVIRGRMSLVGPRPPLVVEVEKYADHVHRRFLMKPGMTGLWQVSGRSLLSWEDSVRLDLSYVENYSLLVDFMIMVKTFRAVLSPHGSAH